MSRSLEAHYCACLYAGVSLYGINAEVLPGQWKFPIGTGEGLEVSDQLWMARDLLAQVGEYYEVDINYQPKPMLCNYHGHG